MKLALALLAGSAAAYAPARVAPRARGVSLRAEETDVEQEITDLSLEDMFEVFDAADPEGVAEREAEG